MRSARHAAASRARISSDERQLPNPSCQTSGDNHPTSVIMYSQREMHALRIVLIVAV
jgi:hypothetical protein